MSEDDRNHAIAEAVNAQKLDTILGNVDELRQAIKELTKSVNRLAILEERQTSASDSIGRAFKGLEDHELRIKVLEMAQPIQKQSSDILHKVIALVLAGVLGAGVSQTIIPTRRDQVVMPTPKITQ